MGAAPGNSMPSAWAGPSRVPHLKSRDIILAGHGALETQEVTATSKFPFPPVPG